MRAIKLEDATDEQRAELIATAHDVWGKFSTRKVMTPLPNPYILTTEQS